MKPSPQDFETVARQQWVKIKGEGLLVAVPQDVVSDGVDAITAWLHSEGYAVQSKEDWRISYATPEHP